MRGSLWTCLMVCALPACASWVPVHSAREAEGRRVKIEIAGHETVIDQAITCDDEGFILAETETDCRENPERTFDTRRVKVIAQQENTKSNSVGYVVACVLAAIFVPAGIVGSVILGSPLK